MEIEINKFKKIDKAAVDLAQLNVFIGANNSGKSSFIQGIQFAISACQTLELKRVSWTRSGSRTLALDSSDFLYTPTRDIESLYHGRKLTGSRRREERRSISFSFGKGADKSSLSISKGRNGGFTTSLSGRNLGNSLCGIDRPYCVYVPGIAGIPIQEKYEVPIAIRKSATRGDSNNYLRNIILGISKDDGKMASFLASIKAVYGDVVVSVSFDETKSEYIDVNVTTNSVTVPLDTVGTGLLQVIQIFAYIEYFDPKIILLDEPDAHIHPTKQRLLAEELARKTTKNEELKIVFSTHSRYILEALEGRANVVHFQDGTAFVGVKNGSILVDIGAADADHLFGKKHLKYVIATEDKVDGIEDKKDFLRKFIVANGIKEEEVVLHSYEGCKKVHFAKILEGFVTKHVPGARVILHIDRDQKRDDDREYVDLIGSCEKHNISLFFTKYQEIESYFCLPAHMRAIYGLSEEEAERIYRESMAAIEPKTKNKIKDFILNDRRDLALNKKGRFETALAEKLADDWYAEAPDVFALGKELLGKIKDCLQKIGRDQNEIVNISPGLRCEQFQALIHKLQTQPA